MYIYIYVYTHLSLSLSLYIYIYIKGEVRSKPKRYQSYRNRNVFATTSQVPEVRSNVETKILAHVQIESIEPRPSDPFVTGDLCIYIYIYIYIVVCIRS